MSRRDSVATSSFHRSPGPILALTLTAASLLQLACAPTAEIGDERPVTVRSAQTAPEVPALLETTTPRAGVTAPVRLDLPERFRSLLRAEMLEIEAAMQEELRHLARAEGPEGAEVARKIYESFVMKQQLAPEERHQLRQLLPADFLTLDQNFHQRAAEMADAFDRGDFPTVAALYSEMTQACVTCHAHYAAERFGGFAGGETAEEGRPGSVTVGP